MNTCEHAPLIGPYHDNEMSPAGRDAFARHLEGCNQCRAELDRIRMISGMVASWPAPQLSPAVAARIKRSFNANPSRGLVRLAEALSAIAAMVLIVCSVGMMRQRPAAPPTGEVASLVTDTSPRTAPAATPASIYEVLAAPTTADVLTADWSSTELAWTHDYE